MLKMSNKDLKKIGSRFELIDFSGRNLHATETVASKLHKTLQN